MIVRIAAIAALVAPIFNVLSGEASFRNALQGVVDAVVISILVGGFLFFVREGWLRAWFRRRSFVVDFVLSSATLLALFLVGRAAGQVILRGDPRRFLSSFSEPHLMYAVPFFVAFAIAVNFVVRMNRLIGASVLRYFIAGVYHRPHGEERIFMFLDMEGSTKLAERLGSDRYFELLRRFVDDLTDPIVATRGEIYQYAGDEVVVTWPFATGALSANCIRCFFGIRDAIERGSARYQREFGVVPRFRAGLHGGAVTAGELGDLRQQIVFVGDILNTAARLEEHAKRTGLGLVASGAVLDRLQLPDGVAATPCGELELRGKQERVTAYGLERAPVDAAPAIVGLT